MLSGQRSKVRLGTVSNIDRSYKRHVFSNVLVSAFAVAWAVMMQAEDELPLRDRTAAATVVNLLRTWIKELYVSTFAERNGKTLQ